MNRQSEAPIGVYDTGVGGLSVLGALTALLPAESFYYVADGANCPYGDREPDEIVRLALGVSEHLAGAGCKAIVVACNTISATALPALRAQLAIPIVGMVPAVKPAVALTRTGVIGVLATTATVRGALYLDVLERFAQNARVISQPCPGLVDLIEAGKLESQEAVDLLQRCLAPIVEAGADVVVLGCSHYPFARHQIARLLGPGVEIIEPSGAIARQTQRVLEREGLLSHEGHRASVSYATSGDTDAFDEAVYRLVARRPKAQGLRWEHGRLEAIAVPAGTERSAAVRNV
ncbi:MAG: glutamate racemase [Chloroflexi bacterium]|nr:glutamate racemase [Chloroflexota bacterium]